MAKKAPNPIDKHVGSRVRMRRMMLTMSQEKLGDALGLTFQQVQKYEKGTNRIGASRLQQISNILQVPVAFFFEGAPSLRRAGRDGRGAVPGLCVRFLATSDGLALTKAFMRIKEAKLRRRIVDLVEQIARRQRLISRRRRFHVLSPRRTGTLPEASACGLPHLDRAGGHCKKHCPWRAGAAGSIHEGSFSKCHARIICSPASPCPKDIPTRSATRFRTRSSMPSSPMTSSSASPTTA